MIQTKQIQAISLCMQAIDEIYKPHIDNKPDQLRKKEDVNVSSLDELLHELLNILEEQ